ncbi:MAG: DUF2490 domain-containing protein [Brumimicrobium sp.]|nr:DUF2490 domain-containing protein [Brumimicrobium sp.]
MMIYYFIRRLGFFLLLHLSVFSVAQDPPEESVFSDPSTEFWAGSYMNFRVSDKFFWAGEFHLRSNGIEGRPFVGYMSKIYNRHGIKYMFSKYFNATAGGVLRLNFSRYGNEGDNKALVLEPRFWHEYVFANSFDRFMIYHRLRFEHRWTKPNKDDAEYRFRNRYRYMITAKIPLNKKKLVPGAYYFSPFIELIMQSGKSVIANPLEDLRIYPHFGYIINPQYSVSLGILYTTGQSNALGYTYRQRWIPRANVYINLDFRKQSMKIPEINLRD